MVDAFPEERDLFGRHFTNGYKVASELGDERGCDVRDIAFFIGNFDSAVLYAVVLQHLRKSDYFIRQ